MAASEGANSGALIEEARYWQRRRRVVRVGVAAVVLAALGGGIGIGIAFFGGGAKTAGTNASISAAGIFHFVTEAPDQISFSSFWHRPVLESPMVVDLATGSEHPVQVMTSNWYDPVQEILYTQRLVDGRLVMKTTEPSAALHDAASPEVALDELATSGIHGVLLSGAATRAGSGVFDGRPVLWVRFGTVGIVPGLEVAVEQPGGAPLAYRNVCTLCTGAMPVQRVLAAAHVAAVPAGFPPPPKPGSGGGGSSSASGSPLALPATRAVLGGQALFVGGSLDGLKLTAQHVMNFTAYFNATGKEVHSRGVEFVYGQLFLPRRATKPGSATGVRLAQTPLLHLPPSITIIETRTVEPGGMFSTRAGFMGSAPGNVYVAGPGLFGEPLPSQGQALVGIRSFFSEIALQKDGVYIMIRASSPAVALEAARSLEPVP